MDSSQARQVARHALDFFGTCESSTLSQQETKNSAEEHVKRKKKRPNEEDNGKLMIHHMTMQPSL